jgi:APA family basic amino acid/polyamine antiporter
MGNIMEETRPTLKRSIGLAALIFYGVGTMVGAGFYALIGKVVGESGSMAPLALAGSGLLALINAFAFAEFSSRFPVSAGEARYIEEGLGRVWLSTATGILVAITGVVSSAALAKATSGFLQDLMPIDRTLGTILVVLLLGGIAAWGIGQSMFVVVLITIAEVATLLLVIFLNVGEIELSSGSVHSAESGIGGFGLIGIFSGVFLGFYAFIGFEDMVNVAEEVKRPHRNLPVAILVSVVITTVLYIAVSFVAVSSVDLDRLSQSQTPIAELIDSSSNAGRIWIGVVSIFAGVNGALVQIIMASRVCYGLASRDRLPNWMGKINPRTRTPVYTTGLITLIVLILAVAIPLTQLAKVTSAIILTVFALVNFSLWRLKGTRPDPDGQGPRYPRWVPMLGFLCCLGVLLTQAWVLLA